MWSSDKDRNDFRWCVVGFIAILLCIFAFTVVKASFRANAYNNVTGKHVSTWDAYWLDLRVQEPAIEAPAKPPPITKKD